VSLLRAAQLEPAWHYRVGSPALEIVEWAEAHDADLIVIGSHGRGAFTAALLGSVASRVAATCSTPLLLLRLPDRKAVRG
jgi:nucleotide-binding universal stress UspA family protein